MAIIYQPATPVQDLYIAYIALMNLANNILELKIIGKLIDGEKEMQKNPAANENLNQ